MEEVVGECRRV